MDIWHDPDGVWTQIGTQTYGPFATEAEAEAFASTKEGTSAIETLDFRCIYPQCACASVCRVTGRTTGR